MSSSRISLKFTGRVAVLALSVLAPARAADTWLDTQDREAVWAAYIYRYWEGVDAPMDWTGTVSPVTPGSNSGAFLRAELNRLNFYRQLAGVRPFATWDPDRTRKAQAAAVVMAANPTRGLTHVIDTSWAGYSADAADGAMNSNLIGGTAGPAAVDAFMADPTNTGVPHRRWLIEPTALYTGFGNVFATGSPNVTTGAIYVDQQFTRAAHRDPFFAYPAPGYMPYTLVPQRWLFAVTDWDYNTTTDYASIDASGVTVVVQLPSGARITPPILDRSRQGVVWEMPAESDASGGYLFTHPPGTGAYHVTVEGFTRNGVPLPRREYDVIPFEAATEPALPSAPAPVSGRAGQPLSFGAAANRRVAVYAAAADVYTNTGDSTAAVVSNITRAPILNRATPLSGTSSFVLPVTPLTPQWIALRDRFVPDASTTASWRWLKADNRQPSSFLALQVNAFDTAGWTTLWQGTYDGRTSAHDAEVSLAAYAGREIALRFLVAGATADRSVGDGNPAHLGPSVTVDDIRVTGSHYAEIASLPTDAAQAIAWTPPAMGTYRVALGARYFEQWDGPAGASRDIVITSDSAKPSTLANLSIRSRAGSGSQTLIMGFVVAGAAKPLLARGIGPALIPFGVTNAVPDPALSVLSGAAVITSNDNWGSAAENPTVAQAQARVGAFALPDASKDAVVLTTVAPGSYTAQVTTRDATAGVALAELYDIEPSATSRLVNVSARAQVGTGGDILIAGFSIVGPSGKTLLVRAVGPTLTRFGVGGVLAHPLLKIVSGATPVFANQQWGSAASRPDLAAAMTTAGAFSLPDGSDDAALLVTLAPGNYTATVEGLNGETGVALVEVYEVP